MRHPELEKLSLVQYLKFRIWNQVFLKEEPKGKRWWVVKCDDCGRIYTDYERGYRAYTRCPDCYEPPKHCSNEQK